MDGMQLQMDGLMEGLKLKYLIMFILLSSLGFAQIQQQHLSVIARKNVAGGEPPAAYVTDSLIAYWDDTSLSNGEVASWYDELDSLLASSFAGNNAVMTDTGLVRVDGDEYHRTGAPAMGIDSAFTIEVVMQIDTSAGGILAGVRINTPTTVYHCLGTRVGHISARSNTTTAGNTLHEVYGTPVHGKMSHIVMTSDGAGTNKLYFDGVLQTMIINYAGNSMDNAQFQICDGNLAAGHVTRLVRFYNMELTLTQVNTNLNSSSVQDKGIE